MTETDASDPRCPNTEIRAVDTTLRATRVSTRTSWHLITVESAEGRIGLGECSDAGPGLGAAWQLARDLLAQWNGDLASVIEALRVARGRAADSTARLAIATVCGGLDQALADLRSQAAGQPLWRWLGAARARPVARYANVNRALRTRTPEEFAQVAAAAVRDGFTAVKCAPFDSLPPAGRLRAGLDRVRSVREAVGPDVELMLDAHHLVTVADVLSAAVELRALNLRWLEDAVRLDDADGLAALHAARIAPLAGGELAFDVDEVRPALESGCLAYLMPDVKHAGGVTGALRLARAARDAGVAVSMHNPSGPVATAFGVHVAVACGGHTESEFAYGEVPWRASAVSPGELEQGPILQATDGPGLGLRLTDEAAWRREHEEDHEPAA